MPRQHFRWDANASPVIPGAPPAAPGWVTSIAFDSGAVVSWDTSQGGGAVQSWIVTPYIGGSPQAATAGTSANGRATVSGLTNSTAYTFQVQVINQAGTALSPMSGANTPLANLIYGDDFNGTVLDPSWVVLTRDSDQSQSPADTAYYLPSAVTLDGASNLVITVSAVPVTAYTYSDANPPTYQGAIVTRPYTGGRVQWRWPGNAAGSAGMAVSGFTQPGFNFNYGKVQVRAIVPQIQGTAGAGGWSAFWMMGYLAQVNEVSNPDNNGTETWPNAGNEEFDLYEGGGTTDTSPYTVNYTSASGSNPFTIPVTNPSTAYNTYEGDWSAGNASWWLNGVQQGSTYTTAISTAPAFLMIDNVVRGTGLTLTQPVMTVDWVRVFHN